MLHTFLKQHAVRRKHNATRGVSLIEVLLAIAIFTLSVAALGTMGISGMTMTADATLRYHAVLALREGVTALRTLRDTDPGALLPGTYRLIATNSGWTLVADTVSNERFMRFVTITSEEGGRRRVRIEVRWERPLLPAASLDAEFFLHQFSGSRWTQTTNADFSAGRHNGTAVFADGDGAVGLPLLGNTATYRTLATFDASGDGTVTSFFHKDGMLFVAALSSSGNSVAALDLADAGNGVVALLHRAEFPERVFALASVGEYLVLGTDGDTREIIVLRRSDLSFVRTVDLPGVADVRALAVEGSMLYVGREGSTLAELLAMNASDPSTGLPFVASQEVDGSVRALGASGGELFAATSANDAEVMMFSSVDLSLLHTLNLQGPTDATTLTLSPGTLFVGRDASNMPELSRIALPPGEAPVVGTSLDVEGGVRGIALDQDGRVIVATPLPGNELRIFSNDLGVSGNFFNVLEGAGVSAVAVVGPFVYVGLENNVTEMVALRPGDISLETLVVSSVRNLSGTADMHAVACAGAYVVAGRESTNSGPEFVIFDDDGATLVEVGALELGADVNGIALAWPYAYLATSDNTRELVVVSLLSPSAPAVVGALNLPMNADATTVTLSGVSAFVGTANSSSPSGKEASLVDVRIPSSPTLLSQIEVGADVNAATFLPGGFIALGTAHNVKELMILDARTPTTLREHGSYNTNGNTDARALLTLSSGAFVLGLDHDGASSDLYFFTFDVAAGGLSARSFLDVGGSVRSIAREGDMLFLASERNGGEILSVDATNVSAPLLLGSVAVGATPNAIASDALSFAVVTTGDDREVLIVRPTPPSVDLVKTGWFTSSAFDGGSADVVWGTISWSSIGTGTVALQIRTALTEEGLQDALWTGMDGVTGAVFPSPDQLIVPNREATGSRFISYRAMLVGDGANTPLLTDITITQQ
jgi:hypothetical protein